VRTEHLAETMTKASRAPDSIELRSLGIDEKVQVYF
jgi:hypothetical protein